MKTFPQRAQENLFHDVQGFFLQLDISFIIFATFATWKVLLYVRAEAELFQDELLLGMCFSSLCFGLKSLPQTSHL